MFENSGTTAYLGTGLNHAENVGVRLGLPASVKEFQAGMGGDDQTVRVQGRDLASLRPIPPGTRPFSFTYHVPMSGRMDLSHRLYFPTDRFVVLIEDPKLKLDSKSLEFAGERDQGGRKFQIYQGANFPVGAEVTMRIQGAGFWSNPAIYPWLIAPFLILAALVFAARRGRKAADVTAAARAADAGSTRSASRGNAGPAVASLRPGDPASSTDRRGRIPGRRLCDHLPLPHRRPGPGSRARRILQGVPRARAGKPEAPPRIDPGRPTQDRNALTRPR